MSWPPLLKSFSFFNIALMACLGACSESDLIFERPVVRVPLPGQDITVAYFVVSNPTAAEFILTGAFARGVHAIQMHETTTDPDSSMTRMRRMDVVRIPPGEVVSFRPGGLHLMLFGVADLPERVPITLEFAERESITVNFSQQAY